MPQISGKSDHCQLSGPLAGLYSVLSSIAFRSSPSTASLEAALQKKIGNDFNFKGLERKVSSLSQGHDDVEDFFSKVSRVEQLESWDCGIICIIIVIRWLKGDISLNIRLTEEEGRQYRALRSAIRSESIWTADLVLQLRSLLENYDSQYLFCSKSFKVDKTYSDVKYYQETFQSDEDRVTKIFLRLEIESSDNMYCAPGGLDLEIILNAVSHPSLIAVVLIDNSILGRKGPLEDGAAVHYVGHYVILCGVSNDPIHVQQARTREGQSELTTNEVDCTCIVLCDPGQGRSALSYVTKHRFELSRVARGTDEDIVFISRPP